MLQSQGLRAASGVSGGYIPPEPGEYDPLIGGYFAGHMTYQEVTLSIGAAPIFVYQLWVEPKSSETSRLSSLSSVGPSTYSSLRNNDQRNGFLNKSTGLRGVLGPLPESSWYIPAHRELHQIFRYLRPVNDVFIQEGVVGVNSTLEWYRNISALPRWYPKDGATAAQDNYGNGVPADPFLVNNPDFHAGGSQALGIDGLYVSSTLIDQTSFPVNADQIGKAVMHMGSGQILNPIYVQDYYNTGTSTYDLNFTAYSPGNNNVVYDTDPLLYTRRVKRRTISVSVEDIVEYYETYEPVRFSPNTDDSKGRFRNKWAYEYNFWGN